MLLRKVGTRVVQEKSVGAIAMLRGWVLPSHEPFANCPGQSMKKEKKIQNSPSKSLSQKNGISPALCPLILCSLQPHCPVESGEAQLFQGQSLGVEQVGSAALSQSSAGALMESQGWFQ